MDYCIIVITPIAHGEHLRKDDRDAEVDVHNYRSIGWSLMFLINSQPDIYHVVSLVSKYMSDPSSEVHLKVTKRILRYVKGTLNLGIHYLKNLRM